MKKLLFILLIPTLLFGQPPVQDNLMCQFNTSIDTFDLAHPSYDKTRTPSSSNCITFNGINQLVTVADKDETKFDFNTSFTLTGWIKTTGNGTAYQTLWGKFGSSKGINISISKTGLLSCLFKNSGTIGIGTSHNAINGIAYSLISGYWTHVAVCYDGSGTAAGLNVYYNGNLTGKTISTFTPPGTASMLQAAIPLTIASKTSTEPFKGSMYDFRCYFGVCKTQQEILNIVNQISDTTGLKSKYNFEEGTGSIAYNSYKPASKIATYGQSYANGALTGSPTYATHSTNGGVYSFRNTKGYSLSGSTYIPRNEANSGNIDALGNSLTYTLPVCHRIRVKAGMTPGINDTLNFNPYNAPIVAAISPIFIYGSFATLPTLPTSYILNSNNQVFCWGEITDPIYVDRLGGVDNQFLIYRNFNKGLVLAGGDSIGKIKKYINRPETNILLIVGQSNGRGTKTYVTDLPGLGYASTVYGAAAWSINQSQFIQEKAALTGSLFDEASFVGADLSASTKGVSQYKDKIFVVKHTLGGTSLDSSGLRSWWAPSVLNGYGDTSKLYPGLKDALLNALSCFDTNYRKLKVVLYWDQGESDCNPIDAPLYGSNFKTFATQLRSDLGLPNMPIVARLLSTYQKQAIVASSLLSIRASMIDLATNTGSANYVSNVTLIDSNNNVRYTVGTDQLHFKTSAQINLGIDLMSIIILNNWFK